MNCLYITLFFNIFACIVQTFIVLEPASVSPSHRSLPPALWTTSWLLLAPHHRRRTFSQRAVSLGDILDHILPIRNLTINSNNLFVNFRWTFTFCVEKSYDGTHLAFGGTLDRCCHFKHGSQVKDQGRRQCCHNKHKKFPYRPTRDYPYFPDTPRLTTKRGIRTRCCCFRRFHMGDDRVRLTNFRVSPGPAVTRPH